MAVQVVHDDAEPAHPIHLPEQSDSSFAVKVVEEEGRVGDVEGIVGVGKGQGISDLDPHLETKSRGEGGVEPGASASHRDGIQVHPDGPDSCPPFGTEAHRVHQVVARARSQVQKVELRVSREQGPDHSAGRPKAAEQSVDPPKVAESSPERLAANVGGVHPLGAFVPRLESGKGEGGGHNVKNERERILRFTLCFGRQTCLSDPAF